MTGLAVIGSTGSIGVRVLNVVRRNTRRFRIVSLAAEMNVDELVRQAAEFKPRVVCVRREEYYLSLKNSLPKGIEAVCGEEGLLYAASAAGADTAALALSGLEGLKTAYQAIISGKNIALANKEALVSGGEILMREARERGVKITPIDSEHSAVLQCVSGAKNKIKRIILTASGGPFFNCSREELARVTSSDALKHPTWRMGKKITVDSATMMNKGLEIIEAQRLFGITPEYIIHPQSIIHSMAEFEDNSVIAQMAAPDMELPIQYALTAPKRLRTTLPQLNFAEIAKLEFFAPKEDVFPCPRIARAALKTGGLAPAALNAANDAAVCAFLDGNLAFLQIPSAIEYALEHTDLIGALDLENIYSIHNVAAATANKYIYG